jgi:hypothetical protein
MKLPRPCYLSLKFIVLLRAGANAHQAGYLSPIASYGEQVPAVIVTTRLTPCNHSGFGIMRTSAEISRWEKALCKEATRSN